MSRTAVCCSRSAIDQLDGQTIRVFDHDRSGIAERVWPFDDRDAREAKARHEIVEPLDRECNVIQCLPARPNERLIATTSIPDTLTRIPRHAPVREPDAA